MVRRIGLHVRLLESLSEVTHKVEELQLPFFQCFFVSPVDNRLIRFSEQERQDFLEQCRPKVSAAYLHGSYWINLAGLKNIGYGAFCRELALAKELNFTHMILHPGAAKGGNDRQEGIEAFARRLNRITAEEQTIKFMIENTAHGGLAVGSDLADFKLLRERLNHPEKIGFVLDTGHAFVYGYDLGTVDGQDAFIALVDETMGIDNIDLIHLNDAIKPCGSKLDYHAVPGKGLIGIDLLRRFVMHPRLVHIPLLMEPPQMTKEEEIAMLAMVRSWHDE